MGRFSQKGLCYNFEIFHGLLVPCSAFSELGLGLHAARHRFAFAFVAVARHIAGGSGAPATVDADGVRRGSWANGVAHSVAG